MSPTRTRILLVDDDANLRRVLEIQLESSGHAVTTADSAAAALEHLDAEGFDVIITDIRMPEMDGLALLGEIKRRDPGAVVVILTAHGDIKSAVRALKEGAFDFLTKPIAEQTLLSTVARASNFRQMSFFLARQREALSRRYSFDRIIGASPAMEEVFQIVRRAAPSDVTVLLRGETGTGKELFARAIHHNSERRTGPFVSLNCAAIPESLLESAFFGHEKGAFTGANSRQIGCYEEAHGGTLFLDEIGLLNAGLQGKLLRVIESGTLRRIGGREDLTFDVRLIAATNSALESMVEAGDFRQDLYFRLRVLEISLPPLRDRLEDLPLLVEDLLVRLQAPGIHVEPEAMDKLARYSWPGNVRELRNVLERALILRQRDDRIAADDIDLGHFVTPGLERRIRQDAVDVIAIPPSGISMDALEKRLLETALTVQKGNRSRAARWLGLGRHAFLYRLKKHGIEGDGDAE